MDTEGMFEKKDPNEKLPQRITGKSLYTQMKNIQGDITELKNALDMIEDEQGQSSITFGLVKSKLKERQNDLDIMERRFYTYE